ncbi:MAG: DUF4956 domain-containing protein [Bacteroidaceae bacterium]|nr:DUF4956 domain-containing protein [Bacteroidaceae bacterium]
MNLLSLVAGGAKAALAAAEELDLDVLSTADSLTTPMLADWGGLTELLLRFLLNVVVISFIVRVFYYPKSKRRDYFVTFILIAISIFLIIYLMGGVKLKTGVALGLFAIFGIIRYRTESVPIREMTYLFLIIAVSTINALDSSISYVELLATNLLFIISIWVMESNRWVKHVASKLVMYDNIALITPEREPELIEDLKKRTGLDVLRVEVGAIDFSKDTAMVKIYYEPLVNEVNSVNHIGRLPKMN